MTSHAHKPPLSGVLLVDKPQGMTSHDVVARVRRIFGQREVGHTGTLDPMATGLLVLTLGKATRIGRFIEAEDKVYIGTVTLGRATTTFDAEGETTTTGSIEGIDHAKVEVALRSLEGTRLQKVPSFSAVKVAGERLYQRARRGEAVDAPEREVTIHALSMRSIALPNVEIEARVSKGTYIRSLAVEIGDALSVPAHLSALRRTRVGPHAIAGARPLDALEGQGDELLAMEKALVHLPSLRLDPSRAEDVFHGRILLAGGLSDRAPSTPVERGAPILLLSPSGTVLAVGEAAISSTEWAHAAPKDRAITYACVLRDPS
jgi:tRNA pseudouridine55 synthase